MKKLKLGISGLVSLVLFLVLAYIANHLGQSQLSQQAAERWNKDGGVSQISCFFPTNSNITADTIEEFEHTIDRALADGGVTKNPDHPDARLWIGAYSANGNVTISNDRNSMDAAAIGVGGDFFLFHPLDLISGSYFSGNDIFQDYCIIDQDAAWRLFGSNNVAGLTIYIGGTPHVITGVIRRPEGRLEKEAGLKNSVVYLSYSSLQENGSSTGINAYETVMPNPVSGFAYKYVEEHLGSDPNCEVIENTSRYSLLSRLKLLTRFGTRSMQTKTLIYPYWENIARGYEDIVAVLTVAEMGALLYVIVLAFIFLIGWYRHKKWTVKGVFLTCKDRLERLIEKIRAKRKKAEQIEIEEKRKVKRDLKKDLGIRKRRKKNEKEKL